MVGDRVVQSRYFGGQPVLELTCNQERCPGSKWLLFFSRCMECQCRLGMRKVSVRPSVRQMRELWKNEEKSAQIFIPYKRPFSLVFWEKEWLVGATLLREILGQTDGVGAKSPIIALFSVVALIPSEKSSINTNWKSLTCFPMSLVWSSYVAPMPSKGGLETVKLPISV